MDTCIARAKKRIALKMRRRGTPITLNWVTIQGGVVDPTTGAELGTNTAQSETIYGLVHFPEIAAHAVRLFEEIETGDCIIDIPPDTVIEGRKQLTFTIDGEVWVQKPIGDKLAKSWELVAGQRLYRSVLLRKQT